MTREEARAFWETLERRAAEEGVAVEELPALWGGCLRDENYRESLEAVIREIRGILFPGGDSPDRNTETA